MGPAVIILVGMAAMVLLVIGGMNVIDDANRRHGGTPSWLPQARLVGRHARTPRGHGFRPLPSYEGRNRVALWTGRIAGMLVISVGIACAVIATGVAIVASIVAGMS
jgi:hypothetical protein